MNSKQYKVYAVKYKDEVIRVTFGFCGISSCRIILSNGGAMYGCILMLYMFELIMRKNMIECGNIRIFRAIRVVRLKMSTWI